MIPSSTDIIQRHILSELKNLQDENALLKQWIKDNAENARCAVCGKPLGNLSAARMVRPIVWHDRNCFQWKPRKIIALERDFRMTIQEILQLTSKQCGNIKAQSEILDVSVPYLYSIIRKYGGDFIEFMAQHTSGKRRELYAKKVAKRTNKSSKKNPYKDG